MFLEKKLPANKGSNEFSGQTYYGLAWDYYQDKYVKDTDQVYVFTATGYTFTGSYYGIIKGSYAYDSTIKNIWLGISTIDGKDRSAYYAEQTAFSGHNYADDNAFRAAQTNGAFEYERKPYSSANKTIGWEY